MIILPSAAQVLLHAIVPGTPSSGGKLDTAYIEFINGEPQEPPEVNAQVTADYYALLNASLNRDYLRVPVLHHSILISEDSDAPKLRVIVVTDGNEGIHGKPFSAAAGSRLYGIALAASQTNNREDILFSQHYYQIDEQIEKPENGGIMATLEFALSAPTQLTWASEPNV
jgi:hypothetical protein